MWSAIKLFIEKISKQESKEDSDDKISLKKTDLEESEDDEKMALAESGDEEESMAEEKKVRFSKNASEWVNTVFVVLLVIWLLFSNWHPHKIGLM